MDRSLPPSHALSRPVRNRSARARSGAPPAAARWPRPGRGTREVLGALCTVLLAAAAAGAQGTAGTPGASRPWLDASRPIDQRVRDLLGAMTPEEKFWQLYMIPGDLGNPAQDWSHGVFGIQVTRWRGDGDAARDSTRPRPSATIARLDAEHIDSLQRYFVEQTRLGIPMIPFEEAVHGITRRGATVFPAAIALAATFDTALMGRVARAIAAEARTRGIRQVLSPVVNMATDVRWGRVEETYGEDPYLSTMMAESYVAAFERAGIVATPKHFVANVGAGGRDSYPIDASPRELAEVHFPPFKGAIQHAGAQSVMTAYNSVDGTPATQNRWLLTDVLRRQWGFRGFVISDAAATGGATVLHMTEPNTPTAAQHAWNSGLDVVFQSSWEQYRPYWQAIERGLVPPAVIDSAVAHVLRAKFALGLFEHPYGDPDSAAAESRSPAHVALARAASAESIVLLKNAGGVLPLGAPRSVAVIGTDATEARLGGYSAPGEGKVSILDGIRARLGARGVVRYAPGPGRFDVHYVTVPSSALSSGNGSQPAPGVRGEYWDNITLDGEPRLVRTDRQLDFRWTLNSPGRGIPFDWYSARWTGVLTVPEGGVRQFGVEGNDGYRLWVDDSLLIDDWRKVSYGRSVHDVALAPGSRHAIRLEYFESTGNARLRLVWDAGVPDEWRGRVAAAVDSARRSDVAVVVAGVEEGEFRDRAHLALPGHQEDLIRAVAATGTPVVVVLVGGSAITMSSWLDQVDGVVDAWYPGEQGGNAVADVLFGDADPAGRLPVTFPVFEGQLPLVYNHKPTGRGDDYVDLTGMPLFPFGYGLSYTRFAYSDLAITPGETGADGPVTVHCTVTNVGNRPGDEVVQLYLRDVLASVARPVMELRGFQRIHLDKGASRTVSFRLTADDLGMLDAEMKRVVEPGSFRIMIGSSSEDIRLRGFLTVR